ncbi:MAG: DUF938 domain-containing protein [Pseudomonadota bacterium]
MSEDHRQFAPSVARNRDALRDAIGPHLPQTGTFLEIASGSGEHVVHFSARHPGLTFQPSDPDASARKSIDAWSAGHHNIRPALTIDATGLWPITEADVVFNANMIHISPWTATEGLVRGAAMVLPTDGKLITYGPYKIGGQHISDGNTSFDQSLREQNPAWGIRALEDIDALAQGHGFAPAEVIDMPANNKTLIFVRL